MDKVYNQKVNWECGNYTYLVILNHHWIEITEEQIVALPNFLSNVRATNILAWFWLKNITARIRSLTLAKNYLAKWYYIAGHTSLWNFQIGKKDPYYVTFDWDDDHFFVIKKYIPEKKSFLCQNSWWESYWIKWDFYIKEEDWKYLINPVRINI